MLGRRDRLRSLGNFLEEEQRIVRTRDEAEKDEGGDAVQTKTIHK